MNFAELRFWELLVCALAAIFCVRAVWKNPPQWFDKVALLSLGLFLLANISGLTFGIFLAVAVLSYFGLKWILQYHGRAPRRYLFILIPLQLLPLIFYKYGDFLLHTVMHLNLAAGKQLIQGMVGQNIPALRDLIIPVGISFYTFQKVAFVVDTIAFKQPLPRFLDYMNFAGFFPQIVAGPIERRQDLLPQMECFRFAFTKENIDDGVGWIALGLFFKCALADNLATWFDAAPTPNAYLIWMANVFFGLRIYYDFAGYSFIAFGLARCLGIRLTLNFHSPFLSTSIGAFWRHWHITLSQWFRDYLYIPMGGGRVGWWAVNLAVVFVVSGLWHGAGWGFILWGASHGAFLILNRLFGKRIPMPALAGWLLTTLAVFFVWPFFYESQPSVFFAKFQTLLTPSSYSSAFYHDITVCWKDRPYHFLALCGLVFLGEWLSLSRKGEPYYYLRKPAVVIILVVLTIFLMPESNTGFMYFAF